MLDLTRVIAGPVAGRVLAAHGADVLAVSAAHLPQVDLLVIDTGFGKRSTLLDLRRAPDRAVFDSLLAGADALVESYRPGALAALGYGPAELAERAPGLVVVDVRVYGRRGPWALRRGFDSVVQLASGIAATGAAATGVDRPVPLPCQALDHATGWLAALAVVAGLLRQRAEGGSWRADVALSTTAAWLQGLGTDPAGLAVADPTAADVADLLVETDSAHGRLRHVAMPGRLGAIPTGWSSPPPLLGADEPRWPAR
ncbi:MAG: CoA transferase [Acidimicrobiales bacterium]